MRQHLRFSNDVPRLCWTCAVGINDHLEVHINKISQFEVYLRFMCEIEPIRTRLAIDKFLILATNCRYERWHLKGLKNQFLCFVGVLSKCVVFPRLPRTSLQVLKFLIRKLVDPWL
jgi:hypothetical protein